jgi:hypothetical protein
MYVGGHIIALLFDTLVVVILEIDYDLPSIDGVVVWLLLAYNAEKTAIREEKYFDTFVFLCQGSGPFELLEIVFFKRKDKDGAMIAVQYDLIVSQHTEGEKIGSDFGLVEELAFW